MAETTRITVTLPTEQVAALKKITDNVSGYVAEAVARRLRYQLREEDLRRYEERYGEITDEELAEAYEVIAEALGRTTSTEAA
ncbi:hypothetical protein [Thermoactinospora rubra]|uniref:hypothetical protein n=1 Tax=Thermoactinospora rubra TaxID=1088767 RepID=UPI000A122565|nr:hypothetical protein [Thermoactinospora rubra]